jgi:hypothetical protein
MLYNEYSFHSCDMALYKIKFGFTDDNEPFIVQIDEAKTVYRRIPN